MESVKFMSNWEEYVRTVEPYVPGEQPNQPDMIKLNTNENPYPPAPGVVEALKNFDTDKLRLYPGTDLQSVGRCDRRLLWNQEQSGIYRCRF